MRVILAAKGGYQSFVLGPDELAWLWFAVAIAVLALVVGVALTRGVLAADTGTPGMRAIAAAIQEGAATYLRRQFRTIALIVAPLAAIVFLTSTPVVRPDGTTALSFVESGTWRTASFLVGCCSPV